MARNGRWFTGVLVAACVLYPGFVGLWEPSLETLALTIVSVFVAVLIGIPLGVGGVRSTLGSNGCCVRCSTRCRPFPPPST